MKFSFFRDRVSTAVMLSGLLLWSTAILLAVGLMGAGSFWERFTGSRYLDVAEAIVAGEPYSGLFCCMPLYPLTLAGLIMSVGYHSTAVMAVHIMVGVVTVLLAFLIGRQLFTTWVGLLAGGLLSVHPYLVKLTMQLIDTGFATLFVAAGLLFFLWGWMNGIKRQEISTEQPKHKNKPDHSGRPSGKVQQSDPSFPKWKGRQLPPALYFAVAGLALGLATLSRTTALFYTLMLTLLLLIWFGGQGHYKKAALFAGCLGLCWAATMAPWWLYNWQTHQQFIPTLTNSALQILKGHTEHYDKVHPNYDTDHFAYVDLPKRDLQNDPLGLKANREMMAEAVAYIQAQPGKALTTDLRKLAWLYGWHKVPRSFRDSQPRWDHDLMQVVDDGDLRPALQELVYSVYWVPVLILFIIGLISSRYHWQALMPLYALLLANAVVVAIAFADTRYRLDVEVAIITFAAYGLLHLATRGRRWRVPLAEN